jgi:hypothetical protein
MGLEQCLKSFSYGVAIIPETYLLHPKKSKRIVSATILEDNPFDDTDFPVVIICWGPSDISDYEVYKNDNYLGTNSLLTTSIPKNKKLGKDIIKFNDINGNLGIICIDKGDLIGGIRFTTPDQIKGIIKVSSRTSTKVMINSSIDINRLIIECNKILFNYRKNTSDIYMAPFKGNDQKGSRRRRLDFTTARVIIENALINLGYSKEHSLKEKSSTKLNPILFEEEGT